MSGHGWPNRPTWALVCKLHPYRYCYLMEASLACWKVNQDAFDRSGRARRAMTAKLRRDAAANTHKIESLDFDPQLREFLAEIDFEAIADHWPAQFSG